MFCVLQQNALIQQLQEQHYKQYMEQVYQQQRLHQQEQQEQIRRLQQQQQHQQQAQHDQHSSAAEMLHQQPTNTAHDTVKMTATDPIPASAVNREAAKDVKPVSSPAAKVKDTKKVEFATSPKVNGGPHVEDDAREVGEDGEAAENGGEGKMIDDRFKNIKTLNRQLVRFNKIDLVSSSRNLVLYKCLR